MASQSSSILTYKNYKTSTRDRITNTFSYRRNWILRAIVPLNSWGARSQKYIGHHGWGTEKILDFEWPIMASMALKFLVFFQNIFKYFQCFSYSSKQFLRTFFFIKIQKMKKDLVIKCIAPLFIHLIGNINIWKVPTVNSILHILWIILRKINVWMFDCGCLLFQQIYSHH